MGVDGEGQVEGDGEVGIGRVGRMEWMDGWLEGDAGFDPR